MFLKINSKEKEFILVNMVDSRDVDYLNKIEVELSQIIANYNNHIKFKIISSFNWGGTIVALWLTYNYGKIYDDNTYVAQFEEDFYTINDKWLEDSKKILNSTESNYIYIGEHIPPANLPLIKNNIKLTPKKEFTDIINKYCNSSYTNCCWTDGGFYFSTIQNK